MQKQKLCLRQVSINRIEALTRQIEELVHAHKEDVKLLRDQKEKAEQLIERLDCLGAQWKQEGHDYAPPRAMQSLQHQQDLLSWDSSSAVIITIEPLEEDILVQSLRGSRREEGRLAMRLVWIEQIEAIARLNEELDHVHKKEISLLRYHKEEAEQMIEQLDFIGAQSLQRQQESPSGYAGGVLEMSGQPHAQQETSSWDSGDATIITIEPEECHLQSVVIVPESNLTGCAHLIPMVAQSHEQQSDHMLLLPGSGGAKLAQQQGALSWDSGGATIITI